MLLLVPGCSPDSTAVSNATTFEVVGVDVDRRDDVPRNHNIQIVFSEVLDPTSINDETIRVMPEPDFKSPVPLRSRVEGRSVTLISPSEIPTGFRPDTTYRVEVDGFPRFHTVLAQDGRGVARGFRATFRTATDFASDFDPPQVQLDPTVRPSLGAIVIEFTEPVDPRTCILSDTVLVRDRLGNPIAGRIAASRNLRRIHFLPDWDSGESTEIHVTLLSGITDLAGNHLEPIEFPISVDEGDFFEIPVDLTDPDDVAYADGVIPSPSGSGLIVAPRVRTEPVFDLLEDRLWSEAPQRIQMLFSPDEVGEAGWIHTVFFGIQGDDVGPPTRFFEHAEIRLWHTRRKELSTYFHENEPETAVEVQTIPQLEIPVTTDRPESFAIPLGRPFAYNGKDFLVVEILHFGGPDRVASTARVVGERSRVIGATNQIDGYADGLGHDVRFGISHPSCQVESRFFDTGQESPEYLTAVLEGNLPQLADSVLLEFEGAHRISPRDGRSVGETSGFTRKLSHLSGYRFIRLRLSFLRSEVRGQAIEVQGIKIPYRE